MRCDYPVFDLDVTYWTDNQFYSRGDYMWDVKKLWELSKDLPVYDIPLFSLQTDQALWDGADTFMGMLRHCKLINQADLRHPIILDSDGHIADGRHRLGKALMLGRSTIPAKRLISMPDPDYVMVDGEVVKFEADE